MNMQLIDWLIVVVLVSILTGIAFWTRRYVRSVADFMAANRCADRWLLTVSQMGILGTISVVAGFEVLYHAGLPTHWWGVVLAPLGLAIDLTGFVGYRMRETKALTLAQFFEMRYSRGFRIYSGFLAFLSGLINYGVFPGVSARFFVHFCGFPEHFSVLGFSIPSLAPVMAVLLGLALLFTFMGGHITIIVTDFFAAQFMNITLIIMLIFLLSMFSWTQIGESLLMAPDQRSMVNPFKTSGVKDFNMWFYLIAFLGSLYARRAWQGSQAFQVSAISPHEQKMSGALQHLRTSIGGLSLLLLPLCAYTYMHHPDFAGRAAIVQKKIDLVGNDTPQNQMTAEAITPQSKAKPKEPTALQKQMTVPIVICDFLPTGLIGIFIFVMVTGFITCDDIYLHSWGTIFIQDCVMPFRKKPLSPRQHIRVLRWSICGVALFAFVFSLLFSMTDYILMYFAITYAIFVGGAGSAIIGGLYWKKGTTAAAYAGLTTGSIMACSNIVLQQIFDKKLAPGMFTWIWTHFTFLEKYKPLDDLLKNLPDKFWINGQIGYFIAICSAIVVYVTVSLIQNKNFDINKMLHRQEKKEIPTSSFWKAFMTKSGLSGPEFTWGDKLLYGFVFYFNLLWSLLFIGISIYYFAFGIPDTWWVKFWGFNLLYFPLIMAIIMTPIFLIFGVRGLIRMIRRLNAMKPDALDDGRVLEHIGQVAVKD